MNNERDEEYILSANALNFLRKVGAVTQAEFTQIHNRIEKIQNEGYSARARN